MESRRFASGGDDGVAPNGLERRRCPRYGCEGQAEVVVNPPYTLIRGELRDIGLNGCFVATRANMRSEWKDEANLRFHMGDHEYSTNAKVANIRPGEGIGLEFHFTNGLTREVARAMIEKLQNGTAEIQLGDHLFHYGNGHADA